MKIAQLNRNLLLVDILVVSLIEGVGEVFCMNDFISLRFIE